jgi:methionyl-tRNA formyltransferase
MARIVFFGTPDFAVPSLEVLQARHEIGLVITRPDRRQGRGLQVGPSPVKLAARRLGLEIWQPRTLRTPAAVERLQQVNADVYVSAAIGFFLPRDVLALPLHGCLNVHPSLLPRWRGAAPISAAILAGDQETGVTLVQMDAEMDAGPVLAQTRCRIRPDDTRGTLTQRLAELGADLLVRSLPRWLAGEIVPRPQSRTGVTNTRMLEKADGRIDWRHSAVYIERMVRAYTPWPGAFTTYRDRLLKIRRADVLEDWRGGEVPGTVIALATYGVAVSTGAGALVLQEIQLAGGRRMSPDVFRRGHRDFVGAKLGSPG